MLLNVLGTHIPSHRVRQRWLLALGASIGHHSSIFRGTTVLGADGLRVGSHCAIGWRCVLDARGGLTIGDNVVLASDTQILTADHDPRAAGFDVRLAEVVIEQRAWLATRSLVLKGVRIGRGAVVAAGAVVRDDVQAFAI